MNEKVNRILLGAILAVMVTFSLAGCVTAAEPEVETREYWPTAGWRRATPEAHGVDSETLAEMVKTIRTREYAIDSVLVVRHGYLLLDAYVAPFDDSSKHIIYSCTKSVVSALTGIAIDQGYIENVDQPMVELFSGRSLANLDDRKKEMTLEDVLTMSTGLACEDSYLYRWRGLNEMRQSKDWVQYVLDLPMVADPGTRFEYCNGASFLLSALIQEKTGKSALEYARENLFEPLGITDIAWDTNPQGINIGWSDLYMRPVDMAKIGYLYLNGGVWDGEQIISAEWVQASTRSQLSATLQDGYGYQWWVDSSGVYMALGYAGQFIFVIPEADLVAVFTSDLAEQDFYVPQELLEEYIRPAAASTKPLPANPKGVALLEERVNQMATR